MRLSEIISGILIFSLCIACFSSVLYTSLKSVNRIKESVAESSFIIDTSIHIQKTIESYKSGYLKNKGKSRDEIKKILDKSEFGDRVVVNDIKVVQSGNDYTVTVEWAYKGERYETKERL